MKSNFRTLVLASAVAAVAAIATIPAMAATTVTLKVPFSFTVNGHTLPAGEYALKQSDNMAFIRLQNTATSESYNWVASPGAEQPDRVAMRFNAETHALETVQFGTMISPRIDKGSKAHETVAPIEVFGR